MESLLRWSIENSTPQDGSSSDAAAPELKKLDPEIIDHILGKPDAEQMKNDLAVALDVSKSEPERVEALDHLELVNTSDVEPHQSSILTRFPIQLIEHIDNANSAIQFLSSCLCYSSYSFFVDLHKLGLWEPLQAVVTAEKSTPDIQVHALWVIGTAVQHNPAAQDVVSNVKLV
jgi:hypothetical protein